MAALKERLIRYEDLMPCKAAFIDAKTPGSHLKDNYSIIGSGVSESTHQKVNLSEKHGFCIGAAGQPPRIKNSPHSHYTAEVFMVYSSSWRFYWNNDEKSDVILTPGDIISLPTNMFRGFENVGDEYGMIFSILGHDDAGGGVQWLPRVIQEAQGHGLILMGDGKLVDTTIGETVPEGLNPMAPLTTEELETFDQYSMNQMMQYVGKVGTYKASSYAGFPNQTTETLRWIDIIGPSDSDGHSFQVKPGDHNGDQFNVYGLQSDSTGDTGSYSREEVEVMLVHRGQFKITCMHGGETIEETLKDGDIISFPKGSKRRIEAVTFGFAYLVVGGDYPEPPTQY
ncbi:MAG: cupin domain-containing protein [Bacteroidota bacterium]